MVENENLPRGGREKVAPNPQLKATLNIASNPLNIGVDHTCHVGICESIERLRTQIDVRE